MAKKSRDKSESFENEALVGSVQDCGKADEAKEQALALAIRRPLVRYL